MINLLFLKPYNESLSFLFDNIQIGMNPDSDILIPSEEKGMSIEIYLRITKRQLEVSTNKNNLFFLLNGKKVSGNIKLKEQDTLSFQFCEFKILQFNGEIIENNESKFENNYQKFNKKESIKEKEIIETLEKNIFIMEKELSENV